MLIFIFVILLAIFLLFKGTRTIHETIFPRIYREVDFPESRFKAGDRIDFQRKVHEGYGNMKVIYSLFCGLSGVGEPCGLSAGASMVL